jgi:protein-S-isoprenylcysteine O-methyltransferase Ste14
MYFDAIFMMLTPYLAFRSLFVLIEMIILNIFIMRLRIKIGEETLIGTFGEEYRNYMNRTKRLIPFIY